MTKVRLDDLYKMVAQIYSEQNLGRSVVSTFAHFVEVCGMLTLHDRKKKRERVTVTDALCKALGWYFPLLAKMKVRSVEELVYRKFPYVCPYCRLAPHRDEKCKLVIGTGPSVDHQEVRKYYYANAGRRPDTLNAWQAMFQEIYPRGTTDSGRSTVGLLEELGELAEAIRVYEKHPKYFIGEAADTFSYLMGIANEHAVRLRQDSDQEFSFEAEFLKRYPGLCVQCGSKICVCPSVPEATIGRMAKELEIEAHDLLFVSDPEGFAEEGRTVAHSILEQAGGYAGLTSGIPFDRGEANRALVTLCSRMASAIEDTRPELAEKLRAEAVKIVTCLTYAGSPKQPFNVKPLLAEIVSVWRDLNEQSKTDITSDNELLGEIGGVLDKTRVLFAACSPLDEKHIRVTAELRAAREAAKLGRQGGKIEIKDLPAATIEDMRRDLLALPFDVVHMSGHGNGMAFIFENLDGSSSSVPLNALGALIKENKTVKCVIFNSCNSAATLTTDCAPLVVCMDDSIEDDAAIEFTKGFYDALAAGRQLVEAVEIGINAVRLKNLDASPIIVRKR